MRGARHGCPRTDGGGNGKPRRAWFTSFSLPLDLVSGADSAASLSGVDRKVRMASVLLAALTSLGAYRRNGDCEHHQRRACSPTSGVRTDMHACGCKWQYAGEERAQESCDECREATRKRGMATGLVRGRPLIRARSGASS